MNTRITHVAFALAICAVHAVANPGAGNPAGRHSEQGFIKIFTGFRWVVVPDPGHRRPYWRLIHPTNDNQFIDDATPDGEPPSGDPGCHNC